MRTILKNAILLVLSLLVAPQAAAQIVKFEDQLIDADSIRNDFDHGPFFGIYKDNYFTFGTAVGEKPTIHNSDVKFQISIAQRLTRSTLPFHTYLFLAYSQKCIWRVLEESLPMRDLNFNPSIGLSKLLIVKGRLVGKTTLLLEHESNGRDGLESRSWNKVSLCANVYLDANTMIHGKYWIPIVDGENNKDITSYSGIFQTGMQVMSKSRRYGFAVTLIKRKGWNLNHNVILEYNYRLFPKDNQFLFVQYYNGYGENMLDYNKFRSQLRVGIVMKPKFFSEF